MAKIVNDIEIDERIYDPRMDLYAVFGRAVNADSEPFIVAWQKRNKEKLKNITQFSDEETAREMFTQAVLGEIVPRARTFFKDDQQNKVYAWEAKNIDVFGQKIEPKEAKRIIREVSKDYDISPPKLKWTKKGQDSYYRYPANKIEFSHRTNTVLLHELAHAILYQGENSERSHIHHGPQFVWTAIELYQKYAGFDLQEMIISANKEGLLGDLDAEQIPSWKQLAFNQNADLE